MLVSCFDQTTSQFPFKLVAIPPKMGNQESSQVDQDSGVDVDSDITTYDFDFGPESVGQEREICKGPRSTKAIVQFDGPGDSSLVDQSTRRRRTKNRAEGHQNSCLSMDRSSEAYASPRRLPRSDLSAIAPSLSPDADTGPTRLSPGGPHSTASFRSSPHLAQTMHQHSSHARSRERKKTRKESRRQRLTEERAQAGVRQMREAELSGREEGDGMLHQQCPTDTELKSHHANDSVHPQNEDQVSGLICPVCDKMYKREISLNRHFERRHAADGDMGGTTLINAEADRTTATTQSQSIVGRKRKREDDQTTARHNTPSECIPLPTSPRPPSPSRREVPECNADRYSWLPVQTAQEIVAAFGDAVKIDPKLKKTFDDMMTSIKQAHEAREEGLRLISAPNMDLGYTEAAKYSPAIGRVVTMSDRRRDKQEADERSTADSSEDAGEDKHERSSHPPHAADLGANYSCERQHPAQSPQCSQRSSEDPESGLEGSSIFEDSGVDNAAESSPIPTLYRRSSMQPCSARNYFGLLKNSKRRLIEDGRVFLPVSHFRSHVSKAKKASRGVETQAEGDETDTRDAKDTPTADYGDRATSSLGGLRPNTSWPTLPNISMIVEDYDSSRTQFRKFYTKLIRHIEREQVDSVPLQLVTEMAALIARFLVMELRPYDIKNEGLQQYRARTED